MTSFKPVSHSGNSQPEEATQSKDVLNVCKLSYDFLTIQESLIKPWRIFDYRRVHLVLPLQLSKVLNLPQEDCLVPVFFLKHVSVSRTTPGWRSSAVMWTHRRHPAAVSSLRILCKKPREKLSLCSDYFLLNVHFRCISDHRCLGFHWIVGSLLPKAAG